MRINYSHKAMAQLEALSKDNQKRIAAKMRFFAQQQDIFKFAKFIAVHDAHRLRVGDYRIYFEVKEDMVTVRTIKRRDKVYD
jgi:mRNA-degrading endonuclease RelE of RelBE toxin-antitoxin system